MVVISEWLPNPKGSDAAGEWIELHNDGATPASIDGWRLTADGKKLFALHGTLAPGAHKVIPRSESKLSLKNTDGTLALYDAAGHLADKLTFRAAAPEGQSANRGTLGAAFFASSTPGRANEGGGEAGIVYNDPHPFGVPLGPAAAGAAAQFAGGLAGTALALAAAVVFILKAHEGISHLFFQGDPDARSGHR